MKRIVYLIVLAMPGLSYGQEKGRLSLEDYLQQVRTMSSDVRAAEQSMRAAELKLNEAESSLSPEGYAEYRVTEDKKEATSAFAPSRVANNNWKVGVRDQTQFGLSANLYYTTAHTELTGLPPAFLSDYQSSSVGLELKQSLWRDSFGAATRAELNGKRAMSRIEFLKQKFAYKNLLLKAENVYWSLVSFNEIVKLQVENVDRARKLRDRMREQANLRLFDEVDAMQAQAAFESRELELQASLDERASFLRQFNTLRGKAGEDVEGLADLPTSEFMLKQEKNPSKRMSREDLRMAFEQAEAVRSQATSSTSRLYPQLDLVAGLASNGLDADAAQSRDEAQNLRNPTVSVGLVFSVPLDYRLIGNMQKSFAAQKRAAEDLKQAAAFNEERIWEDMLRQKRDAQGRFVRAINLEKLQTELVKKERQRLMNGRTTTFQALNLEQNLALSQIARVRTQLALLQIHNVIKTFEEQL